MEGNGRISEYRRLLDRTLASPELTKEETIHTLVKNQILKSSDSQLQEYAENVVEKRSKEMFNFLSMLRSASVSEVERSKSNEELQSSWKVKQDTDEFRVMYREGSVGTPFHSLLVEGYVDGPLDACLCISCESDLYKKWWPQTALPAFKVTSSQRVKKVRIGEQISLVRMKVSWPLSSREALVHFFALEYLQEGLIVVLLNTISDLERIDKSTHGFTRDGIPDAQDVVRIDIVGGFALQKVSEDRSYFRTIANMDMKLDFVPPAFINFVSRQVVGSGFKLYKKEIASITKGDENFREALKDPMYRRIHEALYSQNKPLENLRSVNLESRKTQNEIEVIEEREEDSRINEIIEEEVEGVTRNKTEEYSRRINDNVSISPEVEQALGTLEKAISMLRGYNSNSGDDGMIKNGHLRDSDVENGEKVIPSIEASSHESKNDSDKHGLRPRVSFSLPNQSKVAPDAGPTSDSRSSKGMTVKVLFDSVVEKLSLNGEGKTAQGGKGRKGRLRFCCFGPQENRLKNLREMEVRGKK